MENGSRDKKLSKEEKKKFKRDLRANETPEQRKARKERKKARRAKKAGSPSLTQEGEQEQGQENSRGDLADDCIDMVPETQVETENIPDEQIDAQVESQLLIEGNRQETAATPKLGEPCLTPNSRKPEPLEGAHSPDEDERVLSNPVEDQIAVEAPKFTPLNQENIAKAREKRKASAPGSTPFETSPKRRKNTKFSTHRPSLKVIEDSDELADSGDDIAGKGGKVNKTSKAPESDKRVKSKKPKPKEKSEEKSVNEASQNATSPPIALSESFADTRIQEHTKLNTDWESLTTHLNTSAETACRDARAKSIYRFRLDEMVAMHNFVESYSKTHSLSPDGFISFIWDGRAAKGRKQFWHSINEVVPGHTPNAVLKYVRRVYNNFTNGAKWSKEEDEELARHIAEKGTVYAKIGRIMGRHPDDCCDRWRNYLQYGKDRHTSAWTVEETELLKSIVREIIEEFEKAGKPDTSIPWMAVSIKMGGIRSRMQCRDRWATLLREGKTGIASQQNKFNMGSATPKSGVRKVYSDLGPEMKVGDKIWLLEKMLAVKPSSLQDVPWEQISEDSSYWTSAQLIENYNKLKYSAPARLVRYGLKHQITNVLEQLRELPEIKRDERYEP